MLPMNAAADRVLMVGAGPVPALGPAGAGVSSLTVALASLGVLAFVAKRSVGSAGHLASRGLAEIRDRAAVLRVGLPIGLATVAEDRRLPGATIYAATLGAADVTAH